MLPWENFDFGPFIRCNLVKSGTVFAQRFIVSLKPFIILPPPPPLSPERNSASAQATSFAMHVEGLKVLS